MDNKKQRGLSPEKHFWTRVDRRENTPDTCWEWLGPKAGTGYGVYSQPAHRWAYFFAKGSLPDNQPVVRHTCDNPGCCNPNHLISGTHQDNMRDMVERGRSRGGIKHMEKVERGEAHPRAKFTDAQIAEVRELRDAGEKLKDIAEAYGISVSHVGNITKGLTRSGAGAHMYAAREAAREAQAATPEEIAAYRAEHESRFWARVNKPEDPAACWKWQGYVAKTGYGQWHTPLLAGKQRNESVSRVAWFLAGRGEVPLGSSLHARCGNKLCCNPAHLETVLRSDLVKLALAARGITPKP